MKTFKIIFLTLLLMLLLTNNSFSQIRIFWIDSTGNFSPGSMNLGNFDTPTIINNQLYGRLPVADLSQSSFTLPSGMSGSFSNASITDSLYGYNATNGAKDTITFPLNGMFRSLTLGIKDTAGGLIDSLAVDVYKPLLASWVTLSNGLFRLYDGVYTSGDVVVPGNGSYKEYYIVGEFINQVRVRWVSPLSPAKTSRKVPLYILGSN